MDVLWYAHPPSPPLASLPIHSPPLQTSFLILSHRQGKHRFESIVSIVEFYRGHDYSVGQRLSTVCPAPAPAVSAPSAAPPPPARPSAMQALPTRMQALAVETPPPVGG
jgi:hypothetical protein